MKLVLANNQSKTFTDFYASLAKRAKTPFEYAGYKSLLFIFDVARGKETATFINIETKRSADQYEGVYINGYLNTYELAATVATILTDKNIPFVNKEMANAPSLSKLTSYAKLAVNNVTLPKTFGGSAYALLGGLDALIELSFPAILKRADADRGIDNYKVDSKEQVRMLLADQDELSLWVLQDFIPNDGFYLVSVYHNKPVFSIFRSLEKRPDHNELKAHMFKPKGGKNAHLIEIAELPESIVDTSLKAVAAMNRQIASVDSIYVPHEDSTYVLEVNYNPQLVTIETFKEMRQQAFLDALELI